MEQHIAQLFTDVILVIAHQGVTKFVGFFYGIGAQTFVRLFTVPGTFLAEFVEYVKETAKASICSFLECGISFIVFIFFV